MKLYAAATLIALLASPALAQQSSLNDRIGAQLGQLVIQNTGLTMQIEQLQAALKAAQDRAHELETKYEPQPAPPADK